MEMQQMIATLQKLGIEHQNFNHPPVMTCEEAQRLCPPMPGKKNKNLFLRDKKKQSYLVSLSQDKQVELKKLKALLGASGSLSFASPERLDEILGVKPGSVGLLALLNDSSGQTQVFVDQDLLDEEWFQSHPGVNNWTTCFPCKEAPKLLEHSGHRLEILNFENMPS